MHNAETRVRRRLVELCDAYDATESGVVVRLPQENVAEMPSTSRS